MSRSGWRLPVACVVVLAASAGGAWGLRTYLNRPAPTPTPAPSDEALVRRGWLLYQTACVQCHGPEGRGDGTSAAEQNPPPRDFAVRPWKHGETTDAVARVIRDGVPGTAMPASPSLSSSDVEALVAFVRTLREAAPRLPESTREVLRGAGFLPADVLNPAPQVVLRDLSGRLQPLGDLRGRVVLLNFWGTTCVHCIKELPALEKLAEELGGRGLSVLSVCVDEDDPAVVGRLTRHLKRMPVYVSPNGKASLRYDVQAMPCVYLLDTHGRLAGRLEGARTWIAAELAPLLPLLGTDEKQGE
jgi:mono/diheme cytochrome c family protein/peroxiredoxin